MYLTHFLCFLFVIHVKFDCSLAVKCQFYNETACEHEESCSGEVDCGQEHHCYVLWQNSTTNATRPSIRTKLKGCFRLESEDKCDQKCVASSVSKNNLFYCCCQGDFCNRNYSWAPIPIRIQIGTTIVKQRSDSFDGIDYMACIATTMVVLLCVLLVVGVWSYVNKRQIVFIKKYFKLLWPPLLDPQRAARKAHKRGKLRNIELHEEIATRKFGFVRKGIDRNTGQKVAVKIMEIHEQQSWLTEQEIYKLPLMEGHWNILQFIGAEKRVDILSPNLTQLWLVTAYHEHESLQNYLRTNTVTWDQLCHIAYSMASGLAHLHEEIPSEHPKLYKPSIAHRDFKSSNVILKSDLTACIADFGLALAFKPSTSCGGTHGQVGTRRYMAPEILEGAINFSRDAFLRIDMYAFGLVLWEIMSRCSCIQNPVPDYKLPFEEEIGLHPCLENIQDAVANKRLRPAIDDAWKKKKGSKLLCETIRECCDHDAEARLSASCAMERITKAQELWREELITF